MAWTDNPARDWDTYTERQERRLARLPHCCECGEPIQTDEFYEFEDGRYICPECLDENHRKDLDDYLD